MSTAITLNTFVSAMFINFVKSIDRNENMQFSTVLQHGSVLAPQDTPPKVATYTLRVCINLHRRYTFSDHVLTRNPNSLRPSAVSYYDIVNSVSIHISNLLSILSHVKFQILQAIHQNKMCVAWYYCILRLIFSWLLYKLLVLVTRDGQRLLYVKFVYNTLHSKVSVQQC